MLNGIDDIDWSTLDGAYGPCTEAPDILRAIASPDPEAADEGRYEFASSIWHQGAVYPATAEAIPFLIELAVTPGVHRRDHLLRVLGALCDPDQADGEAQPLVRASVAVHSGPLLPLLSDPDPEIRRHAAYAAAWSGPHFTSALRDLWSSETHAGVRAIALPGLAMIDPTAAQPLVEAALHDPAPEVRAAAALALTRAGQPLPAAALEAVGDAFAQADPGENFWSGERPGWGPVFEAADPESARILARRMAASPSPEARTRLAHILTDRFHRSRSAAVAMVPLVADLLTDPDPGVRQAAGRAALAAGEAAAPLAETLIAAGGGSTLPSGPTAQASEPSLSPADHTAGVRLAPGANTALDVLARLGHPGYAGLLLAAWAAGESPSVLDRMTHPTSPPFDPAVLAAVRGRLRDRTAGPSSRFAAAMAGDHIGDLLHLLEMWGPDAAETVPEIVACLPDHAAAAASALTAIGPAALPAVPALTERAAGGDVRCGHAVLSLTGNAGPLVAAAALGLDRDHRHTGLAYAMELAADAGPAAAALAPSVRRWLTGAAEEQQDLRRVQVAAARLVWRATGDLGAIVPTLSAVVRAGFAPGGIAADLLTEAGGGADLMRELRRLIRSEMAARPGAAIALHRLGVPADELAGPLLAAVESGNHSAPLALDALVTIRAVTAVAPLTELATRDERLRVGGLGETSWNDDLFRHRIREAIAALTSGTGR